MPDDLDRYCGALADRATSRSEHERRRGYPDVCPYTGRPFFLELEHPIRGLVPTYGGPYDSYTIPERGKDGYYSSDRFDHDFGDWVESESIRVLVAEVWLMIDDDADCAYVLITDDGGLPVRAVEHIGAYILPLAGGWGRAQEVALDVAAERGLELRYESSFIDALVGED